MMTIQELVREFLEDKEETRYSSSLLDDLIEEAIYYIAKKSYQFRKTVQIKTTIDGFIQLPNNFGILQVHSKCGVEIKNIVDVDCECSEEVDTLDGLKYLIEGVIPNALKVCPKIKSLAIYENLEDVIENTIEIKNANSYASEEYLTITYVTKPSLDEVPKEWKMPIVYYVTGTLLRFDKDSQNLQFGAENLRLCDNYIELLKKKKV